jgi:DNA-directed RNA polymerase subunit RPC12/RpoP
MKTGRLVGIILAVVGILVCLIGSLVSYTSTRTVELETAATGGMMLGVGLSVVFALPLLGVGIYLFVRGGAEAREMVDIDRQRKILDMVKTRGQMNLSDLVFELKSTSEQVRNDIYKIVGMGLFTGYVNWNDGVLYSVEASKLTGNKCPNCGAEQSFAGKGVVKCQYCGSEVFL